MSPQNYPQTCPNFMVTKVQCIIQHWGMRVFEGILKTELKKKNTNLDSRQLYCLTDVFTASTGISLWLYYPPHHLLQRGRVGSYLHNPNRNCGRTHLAFLRTQTAGIQVRRTDIRGGIEFITLCHKDDICTQKSIWSSGKRQGFSYNPLARVVAWQHLRTSSLFLGLPFFF